MTSSWTQRIDDECEDLAAAGRWRAARELSSGGPRTSILDHGREVPVVQFASNDYLGLATHAGVTRAAIEAVARFGTGTGASRLVVGARALHRQLEEALAEWRSCEAALLFSTGYAANLGVLTTFGGPGTLICSDELNHASIVDGCRLARAETAVFRHGDLDHLDSILDATHNPRKIVVTDTVFSMDGDVAPIDGLIATCLRHDALLIVDEAHAVLGPPVDLAVDGLASIRVGTLSKTLGSLGGFAAGTTRAMQLLTNRARSFIFTTASTPADTAAGLAALSIVRSPEGAELQARLQARVDQLVVGHPSPIIPIIVGAEEDALAASGGASGAGTPRTRDPAADRRAGNLAAAGRSVRGAPRGRGRSTLSCARGSGPRGPRASGRVLRGLRERGKTRWPAPTPSS